MSKIDRRFKKHPKSFQSGILNRENVKYPKFFQMGIPNGKNCKKNQTIFRQGEMFKNKVFSNMDSRQRKRKKIEVFQTGIPHRENVKNSKYFQTETNVKNSKFFQTGET